MPEPAVLDVTALERLQRVGGPDLVMRMLALFAEEAPARVASVRAAVASGDFAAAERAAHAMVSSAGNIGATELMAAAQGLEGAAMAQHHAEVQAGMARLDLAYGRLERPLAAARREAAS